MNWRPIAIWFLLAVVCLIASMWNWGTPPVCSASISCNLNILDWGSYGGCLQQTAVNYGTCNATNAGIAMTHSIINFILIILAVIFAILGLVKFVDEAGTKKR